MLYACFKYSKLVILTVTQHLRVSVMTQVITKILPRLSDTKQVIRRQGAAEVCYAVTNALDLDIIPFLIFLGELIFFGVLF